MLKIVKEWLILFLIFLFVVIFPCSKGWSQENPMRNEFNALDILIARPLGIAVGIVGTGIFILSLPFSIPTKSVDAAAKIFIVEPFQFSFVRGFPDENM